MKKISLNKGFVTLIDDEDVGLVEGYKWFVKIMQNKWVYASAQAPMVDGKQQTILMHRLILGAKAGQVVDHINRNGLDNQRHNLRLCTNAQNSFNSTKKRKNTTSTYKGVYNAGVGLKPWRAIIGHSYKRKHLGCFSTELEAALAYDEAAKELFGAFARLNFPDRSPSIKELGVDVGHINRKVVKK